MQKVAAARLTPPADQADANASQFSGPFDHFVFEAREDGLWLSYRSLPFVKLERLAPGLYLDDRSIQRQFLFAPTTEGTPLTSVTVMEFGEEPQDVKRSAPEIK